MKEYQNTECLRCGYEWYSEKLDRDNELPEECPRCYRNEVREIPEPPTRVDIEIKRLKEKKSKIPVKFKEKKHDIIIWKEQNRFLISMIETGFLMLLLVVLLVYALFFL